MILNPHVHRYHSGVLLNTHSNSVDLCAGPVVCISNTLPNDADDAGLWTTLLCQHRSVLALDFIKTYLKSVLFTMFGKIKSTSFPFGPSIYEGVK